MFVLSIAISILDEAVIARQTATETVTYAD